MTRLEEGYVRYVVSSSSPSGYAQRKGPNSSWENVPVDDALMAREGVLLERERVIAAKEERGRVVQNNPGYDRIGALITRAEQNKEIAAKLGLNADQLAERLARPDMNQGTLARLPEEEFDAEMQKLGLSPEEARARFKGTHWGLR